METVGQSGSSGAYGLLGVPGLSMLDLDVDDDDSEFIIGIRPKSSPLPRRRSSMSDEDSEPEPPPCGSRRVSFADAKGLSLVQVKEFDTWDIPKLPGYDCCESCGRDEDDYFLSPLNFSLPSSAEELFSKVQEQKVELETIEIVPGTTILRGLIRVLNICFSKAVYIRTTLDTWSSHFDLLAEHIPGLSDNLTDCFSFKLTLVPPFGEQGARVDFCLRYETPAGTFWANNNSSNYMLLCRKRERRGLDKPQWENTNKKSCLKTAGQNFTAQETFSAEEDFCKENVSRDVSRHEEKKAAVKRRRGSDDQPGATDEKGQKLLEEEQQNHIQRSQRQAARMARVRHFFAQRDDGANEPQMDEPPLGSQKPAQERRSEAPESSSKSRGPVKTCNTPTLAVRRDPSQAHDTRSSQPERPESFSVATGGGGHADIRGDPSQTNDSAPAECQKSGGARPADGIGFAWSGENGSRFGTVVAPLYQQVFRTVGSERPIVRDRGNPVQAASNDFTESFPLTDGKETHCSDPTDARGNEDKVAEIKTQETKQDSHKLPKSSTNKEEDEGFMVEESHVAPNIESPKVPEILSNQGSNKSVVLKTVLEDKIVHPHILDSLNPDLTTPVLFTEGLNLRGEAEERNVTDDLQGQSTAGAAQDLLPEQPCAQKKTSTCDSQGHDEEQLSPCLEMSLETALECSQSDSGEDGFKSWTFGQVQEENMEHSDRVDNQDKDTVNCKETATNEDFECHEICQTQNTDMHYSKIMVEEEYIGSTDEEQCQALSFTVEDTEVSEEDHGEQTEDSESEIPVSENIDTTELETETKENKFLEMITVEKDNDVITQDTVQELQETGEEQIGETCAEKERKGAEEGSSERPSTFQEEERADEPAIETEGEQEETEPEKENHTAQTFQVNTERQNASEEEEEEEEEEAVIEEDLKIQSINGDDHKTEERDDNVEGRNPDEREDVLLDLASELESTATNEQESEARRSDAGSNVPGSEAEDGSFAPVNDVQHKQESDKENTGEEQSASTANETPLHKEEAFHSNANVTHDLSKAGGDRPRHAAAEEWPRSECERLSPDDASSESDSDDEVELYMRCLRAVHGAAQAQKDRGRDAGSSAVKSASRGKPLSTPMPSISESADEEEPQCRRQVGGKETEVQNKGAAPSVTGQQRDISTIVSRWDSFTCENVSKTLLYATMLVSFVFVAFYYDFLACFGLYIISLIWLCCQGDRQPVKNNRLG